MRRTHLPPKRLDLFVLLVPILVLLASIACTHAPSRLPVLEPPEGLEQYLAELAGLADSRDSHVIEVVFEHNGSDVTLEYLQSRTVVSTTISDLSVISFKKGPEIVQCKRLGKSLGEAYEFAYPETVDGPDEACPLPPGPPPPPPPFNLVVVGDYLYARGQIRAGDWVRFP